MSVHIDANRQLSASLIFDHADAASAVGEHTDALQKALEQAGFSLGAGGLTLAVHPSAAVDAAAQAAATRLAAGVAGGFPQPQGDSSGSNPSGAAAQAAGSARRAFAAHEDILSTATRSARRSGADSRLDIRI